MAEAPLPDTKSIMARAVDATPRWVWAFSGLQIVFTVCTVAMLQLTGFAAPLQRVVNAQAQQLETAATSLSASATRIEAGMAVQAAQIADLDGRVSKIEDAHRRFGVE